MGHSDIGDAEDGAGEAPSLLTRRDVAKLGLATMASLLAAGFTGRAFAAPAHAAEPAVGAETLPSGGIGLAPHARSGFAHHRIDHAALDGAPQFDVPFNPGVKIRGYSAINEPNCQVIIEDFMPGTEFTWVFTHDEFQVALSGEAELEVWLPPLYTQIERRHLRAGDIYTYPLGARKRIRVLGDQPYRHVCLCPPSPGYPFPTLADLKPTA